MRPSRRQQISSRPELARIETAWQTSSHLPYNVGAYKAKLHRTDSYTGGMEGGERYFLTVADI